ncbi:hypothetical protein, partial [Yinghuangia sp. YIM S10712]|uniref:hypothetical protein n=1 Tax=Yinghuangia sp. YIM S10712 TaxID=3436930 RepID=UPI003F537B74
MVACQPGPRAGTRPPIRVTSTAPAAWIAAASRICLRKFPYHEGESMGFNVQSETGRLRQVILHRPDLELKRLT